MITSGLDANLWFSELSQKGKIGYISPDGKIIPDPAIPTTHKSGHGITSRLDGNLWFTESSQSGSTSINQIGQIGFRRE